MNIKKLVKYSFIVISVLIFFIFGINKIILSQIKKNDIVKEHIATLLAMQENMNKLIKDIDNTANINELEKIKKDFFIYENKFEKIKNRLVSLENQNILGLFLIEIHKKEQIQSNIITLTQNELIIENSFDILFDIKSEKINYQNLFNNLYPKESKIRTQIEQKIMTQHNFLLLKEFSDMKYYSKEILFQHKNQKSFTQWIDKINSLIKHSQIEELNEYLIIAKSIGGYILKIEELKAEENKLVKSITQAISSSNKINAEVKKDIEKLSLEFQNTVYTISTILFLITILFIIILSYKVNKNVSLSVNEIEQQVHNGLEEINKLNQEITDTQREVVFTMGAIGESRSKETGNHVKRVAEYSKLLALLSGLSEEESEMLKQASPMHDIGKVGISDAILNKPGRFDENERLTMNTHAQLGYDMLKHSSRNLLKTAAIVAYEHHEKWDGTGYPRGLKGEEIHIYGRITAIADVFDALGSDRCYKKAWDDEKIFKLFMEEKGKHFDPTLITLFFDHLSEFLKIRDNFKDT